MFENFKIHEIFCLLFLFWTLYITRLLVCFSPIFYFNFLLWLFLWASSLYTKKKENGDFKIFLIIHKLSIGSRKVPHKIWVRLVQQFWLLLHTNKQIKHPNTQIERQPICLNCECIKRFVCSYSICLGASTIIFKYLVWLCVNFLLFYPTYRVNPQRIRL